MTKSGAKAWSDDLVADRSIQKILVMRWSAMGDVALASACFEDVYRAFPDAQIHLNTLPPWDGLFTHDPRFENIIAANLRHRGQQFKAFLAWAREIKRVKYDLIVDLQCTDRSRIMLTLLWFIGAQARYRVGNSRCFPYTLAPEQLPEPVHALARNRRALQAAGVPSCTPRPVLFPGPEHILAAKNKKDSARLIGGRFAVFLPGCQAGGYLKRWGAERYARLADLLETQGLADVVLLGGPDEIDECEKIMRLSQARVHNFCGKTELLELVPLCDEAAFIVANDTGTAHVAAATGVPMLVICGPTDPHKVLPAGDHVASMQADLACINCYRKHCSHHSCMALLTPELVLKELIVKKMFCPTPLTDGATDASIGNSG